MGQVQYPINERRLCTHDTVFKWYIFSNENENENVNEYVMDVRTLGELYTFI